MTINIIRPSDYPVPLSPKYKAPAVAFSAKNTIILNPSLCIAMGLDESHDHIIFGYDKNYPTDLYIRKAAADQLEDAFTLLDRWSARASSFRRRKASASLPAPSPSSPRRTAGSASA